ncbi:fatty acid desaturase [Daejeonella oryzae]|uniref:fatty acid desaturase n=1 Tax=Daejeonella oryzae TaxID=1122943 RepID=UPI000406BB2A|nr:fatty acid desaturase [Daejeonella oryzae]
MKSQRNAGLIIAIIILILWSLSIFFLMRWDTDLKNWKTYAMIFVQMHLYTGLFITAHDAMHGTVTSIKNLNNFIGQTCTLLYALFPFQKLNSKHHLHHRHVHTPDDPDHYNGNFISWYYKFIAEYISWWQIVLMAVIYNVLKLWINELNLIMFWVVPSLLSTLQLFYFGTWQPHHGHHTNKHQSRTQSENHLKAFFSCYFFGYHFEHHDSPGTPWWKLWKLKSSGTIKI